MSNSEEDTFRKLKQVPFNVVRETLLNAGYMPNSGRYKIIEDAGWTVPDYIMAEDAFWSKKLRKIYNIQAALINHE